MLRKRDTVYLITTDRLNSVVTYAQPLHTPPSLLSRRRQKKRRMARVDFFCGGGGGVKPRGKAHATTLIHIWNGRKKLVEGAKKQKYRLKQNKHDIEATRKKIITKILFLRPPSFFAASECFCAFFCFQCLYFLNFIFYPSE